MSLPSTSLQTVSSPGCTSHVLASTTTAVTVPSGATPITVSESRECGGPLTDVVSVAATPLLLPSSAVDRLPSSEPALPCTPLQ